MRVLHVLNTSSFSGAENVAIQIINKLSSSSDIELAYCSLDGSISEILGKNNITFFPIAKLNKSNLKKVVKKYKPDLIHAHDFRASIVSSGLKVPCISHLHNNDPLMSRISLKSLLYSLTIKRYKCIFSVSDSVWDEFVFRKRYSKYKFISIGNPIDVKEIILKSSEYLSNEIWDIGFVGRLTEQKNPQLFINIIDRIHHVLPNIRVAIVGDGPLRDELLQMVKEKGLAANIKFYGFVNNPLPIMKAFKVFCLTSSWEGFGLVAVEALSLGLPVVCSNVGGLPNIVNEESGFICNNIDEFTKALTILLTDKDTYNKKQSSALLRSNYLDNSNTYFNIISDSYHGVIEKQ